MSSLPILCLLLNALVWGLSWWPLRQMESAGLHPLWATALIFSAATLAILAWRPQSWRMLMRSPHLWGLALAAGMTNTAFNWGITHGDVVRVILLFYLMPLWATVLARLMLSEHLTPLSWLRTLLALTGAIIILKPPGWVLPIPSSTGDWLGLLAGFTFALNNVMLRQQAHQAAEGRALAMFAGGMLIGLGSAILLSWQGTIAVPASPWSSWLPIAILMTAAFLTSNLALQYGAARLPASITAIVMPSEIVFATVSVMLIEHQTLTLPVWLGGGCIALASLLGALSRAPTAAE